MGFEREQRGGTAIGLLLVVLVFGMGLDAHAGSWPKKVRVFRGSAPTLDGVIAPGEYDDAVEVDDFSGWNAQFDQVASRRDLHARVWLKHDGRDLYVAFDVTDDELYGFDTARYLPLGNPNAHQLTRDGWPWYGDGVELLVNARYNWRTIDGQNSEGSGHNWQMVASTHKSRLGGLGVGGLLEGEPRSDAEAWARYQEWILSGAMQAAVRRKDDGWGYVIEWKISADPCLEVRPGEYWNPESGPRSMGLNIAVGDLDTEGRGSGTLYHEQWWAGERGKRTWLKQWGTMILDPATKPADHQPYLPGTAPLAPRADLPLKSVPVAVPAKFAGQVSDDLFLNLPAGFTARIFAAGLEGPRFMGCDPEGVLHVANMKAGGASQFGPPVDEDVPPSLERMTGQIIALPDRDGDGVADTALVAVENLWWANNFQFYDGELYVGDRHAVRRFSDGDGDGVYETEKEPLALLPPAQQHRTRTILFDEINSKLYVSVGSTCDICREEDIERAAILEFNADGTGRRVFATGLRNAVGLALHPVTNELWATNNGHDREGRSLPPEWIDIIREDGFYGWPLAFGYQVHTDVTIQNYRVQLRAITSADTARVRSMQRPVALVPAHLAPMAIHFYAQDAFPPEYKNAAFVAYRAGGNANVPGHKVAVLFSEPAGSNARIADFATGFQPDPANPRQVWGKPVGLATDEAGHLYISSDFGRQVVIRVSPGGLQGDWEHDFPEGLPAGSRLEARATVRVRAEGRAVEAVADLSELGGPAALPLTAVDDSTFALEVALDLDLPPGSRAIWVRVAPLDTPSEGFLLQHVIKIQTDGDLLIYGDRVENAWALNPGIPENIDLESRELVFEGETSIAVHQGFRRFELVPPESFDHEPYTALRFAFHPGTARMPELGGQFRISANSRLLVGNGNRVTELLKQGRSDQYGSKLEGIEVDLELDEWQVVEIPLSTLAIDGRLRLFLIQGALEGTFYIDDLRLVVPQRLAADGDEEAVDLPPPDLRVIDTHIHLFDPTRPEGVPWPRETSPLYRPTLPADFRAAAPGISGAIVVEASPWVEDNQWVLDQIEDDPAFLGLVGNLPIGSETFAADLERFAAHPRFLGIRAGNLRRSDLDDERVLADLRLLAAHDLVLDVLTFRVSLATVEAIARAVPDLRIVLNHLAGARVDGGPPSATWADGVRVIAELPNVYCKVSGLYQQTGLSTAPLQLSFYAPVLDVLWQAFGEDRLLYGSNWPVSDLRGDFVPQRNIAAAYFAARGPVALEKVMWRNAVTVYGLRLDAQTVVTETRDEALPQALSLWPNYPNPFNSGTVFRFVLPEAGAVELAVYNLAGQQVAAPLAGWRAAGTYELAWDGRDGRGRTLASGVYFYRLRAAHGDEVRKLLLLR